MMKVLITGFDPFGGESVNPAYEAVKLLPDTIAGAQIIKIEVPTVFGESSIKVQEAIATHNPNIVICVGQAGGRPSISVEAVAINLIEARIPDNKGNQPLGTPVQEDGPAAYFSTLPIKAMVKQVHDNNLPAFISYTAGTFVCNEIMYNLLYHLAHKHPDIKGGFIHVPFETGQVIKQSATTASMSLDTIAKSLEHAIEAAVTTEDDITLNVGTTH